MQLTRRDFLRLSLASGLCLLCDPAEALAQLGEGDALEQRVRNYVRENQQDPFDFILGLYDGPSLVMLGEDHDDARQRRFMVELVPRLKQRGVDYVFLENMYQGVVDDYLAGKEVPMEKYIHSPAQRKTYLAILDALRDAQMRVVCIDSGEPDPDTSNCIMAINIYDFLVKNNHPRSFAYMGALHVRKATTDRLATSVAKFLVNDLNARGVFSVAQEGYNPEHPDAFENLVRMVGPTLTGSVAVATNEDPIRDLPYAFHPIQTRYGDTFDGIVLHP